MDALVTTEWLAGELGASDLRIVDATMKEGDPAADYAAAHIPGAVFMNLKALADLDSPLPNTMPGPGIFASRMQALGIGDGSRIVLYDHSAHHSSARAWFLLRSFGVGDVAILDGGLARWRAEGRPLASGVGTPRHCRLTAKPDDAGVRTLAQMKANLDSHAEQVVDARSPARFTGAEPDPRTGVAPGHIPGSVNLYYAALFAADGTWKRGDALRAAFADAGVDLDRPIVATCGSGITASVIAFAAHLLGRDAAVYDGSWSEWGADAETPKAVGT